MKFEELTEEQQQEAIDNNRDINVDHDWWDMLGECDPCGIDDEEREAINRVLIKWKVHGIEVPVGKMENYALFKHGNLYFDIDRGQWFNSPEIEVINDHYLLAYIDPPIEYMKHYLLYVCDNLEELLCPNWEPEEDELEDVDVDQFYVWVYDTNTELRREFERRALKTLSDEYDYLTSDEAIKDTIIANDYDFDVEDNYIPQRFIVSSAA